MIDIIISLESTCDLDKKQIEENDLKIIHMNFLVDGEEYNTQKDDVISSGLYKKMKEGKRTSTSLINKSNYIKFFEELLKQNKPILHLAFSSGLSNTCACAKDAASELNAKYEKEMIYVVDSLCACSGQGMFAILVKRKAKEVNSIKELIDYAENLKLQVNHDFTVDALKYLANGGRIKPTAAFFGSILNIKPVMKTDDNGKLIVTGKVLSRKKAINTIFNRIKSTYNHNEDICFISHADCEADAEYLKHLLITETTLKPIINNLGPIIGSHSGPGTLSVYYLASHR